VASIEDAAECGERADVLVEGLLGRVMAQRRSVRAALDYVRALSRETRANCWELALRAGHEGPHRMQALLRTYRWRWEELRSLLPGLAQEVLRQDPGDLIGPGLAFDETADLRKGMFTACVSPQHAGVTGKVENCVTWVFAALVTAFGQAWIDFDVYMPECWATDPQRRAKAGIPAKLTFATKPELAIAQAKHLITAGVRVLWAAADEVYGRSGEFRAALRVLGLAYVVIIPCDYRVTVARDKVIRADEAIAGAVFERRSCGNGTKGPRYGDWALIATADPREFLLIRRFPDRDKNQYAFYLGAGRPARDHDVFHHHRRPPLASRNHVQNREGRPRLGPVPGPHLGRDQQAHRPDRPRPAADRRHPGRPRRRCRPSRSRARRPQRPGRRQRARRQHSRPADLHRRRAAACPRRPAMPARHPPDRAVRRRDRSHRAPCPRLESRAPQPRPPRLPAPLVSLAQTPPGPRPLAPLQHPPRSPRHLSHDDREGGDTT
jgi:hypothetical protein